MTNALHAEPASTPAPLALSAKAKSTPSTPISAFPAAPAQILAPAVLLPRDKFPPNVTTHRKRDRLSASLSILDKPTSHLSGSFWVHKGNPMSDVKDRHQPLALDAKMALMDH